MRIRKHILSTAAFASAIISLPALAYAEATVDSGGADAALSPAHLQEVVVTATKRSENLQTVPLPVTAISGSVLNQARIFNVEDLSQSQPSVSFTQFNAFDQQINIRGIVTVHLGDPTNEPSVGSFIDGVYIGGEGIAFTDYFDLDRLEITRGPQGVLYGKNVAGGAISATTAAPKFTPSGELEASYGNYNSALISGHYTAPVTDTLAGRIAFQGRYSDGYSTDVLLDRKMDGIQSLQVRGELLWRPTARFDALLSVDFGHELTNGNMRSADPNYAGLSIPGLLVSAPAARQLLDLGPRQSADPTKEYTRREQESATLTMNWEAFSWGKITSVSHISTGLGDNVFNQTGMVSPPSLLSARVFLQIKPNDYSEDIRLVSTNSNSPIDYILGAFASQDVVGSPTRLTNTSYLAGLIPAFASFSGDSQYEERSKIDDAAVYGQVGYKITSKLKFSVGVRYTVDSKSGFKSAYCVSDGQLPDDGLCAAPLDLSTGQSFSGNYSHTWRALTPQAILQYQITPTAMAYVSSGQGFKGGGWDALPATRSAIDDYFNPEHATNYEVGLKSELLDRRLRLNLAIFDLLYKNLQVQEINSTCLCLVTTNAGNATSKGVEIETEFILNQSFRLTASGSYIDGIYKNFIDEGVNLSGNTLQLTSKYKGNVGVVFTPELPRLGRALEVRANFTYQSRYFLDPQNDATQKAYGLLDASATYRPGGRPWSVSLWGKNLGNKTYEIYGEPFLGNVFTVLAPPRTYGIDVKYQF
jgi:iron complex outermembrane receptor protein